MNTITSNAAALVRRARAGDENAMAIIYRVGQEARKGNARARTSARAIEVFAKANPPKPLSLALPKPVIAESPHGEGDEGVVVWKLDTEKNKPPLPKGALDGVLDPEYFCEVISNAAGYKFGLDAAATVLARGPLLTRDTIGAMAEENFDDKEGRIFLYGVSRSSPDDWDRASPYFNGDGKKILCVGQCFGRARKLQALRRTDSSIGSHAPIIGWELGE